MGRKKKRRSREAKVAVFVAGARRRRSRVRKNFGSEPRSAHQQISGRIPSTNHWRTTRANTTSSVPGMLPQTRLSRASFLRESYIEISRYIRPRTLLFSPRFAERRFTTGCPKRAENNPKPQQHGIVGSRDPITTHKLPDLSDEQYTSLRIFENSCKRLRSIPQLRHH